MHDFGKAPLLLGRMTDDTGTIGLLGSAIAFVSFAINPLIGLGVALVIANDVAHGRAARHAVTGGDDRAALPSDGAVTHTMNLAAGEKFKEVQTMTAPKVQAQSSGHDSSVTADDDGWDDSPQATWAPPAPDLSLLPIAAYKGAVPAGSIDVQQLQDAGVRQLATDAVFGLVTEGEFNNVEHLVWSVFGVTKGGGDWYPVAAQFCQRCREHFVKGAPSSQRDSRVTW